MAPPLHPRHVMSCHVMSCHVMSGATKSAHIAHIYATYVRFMCAIIEQGTKTKERERNMLCHKLLLGNMLQQALIMIELCMCARKWCSIRSPPRMPPTASATVDTRYRWNRDALKYLRIVNTYPASTYDNLQK